MNRRNHSRRNSQRGMSLIETLIAVAVFAVVFIAALMLYTAANKAYLQTDANTVQQQNMRFALDRVVETLRDSGANYNTLGAMKLPDEQVEGMWESAVFVRGDYNNSRESTLETVNDPVHGIVNIANSEIVGYVLRKPVPTGFADSAVNTIPLNMSFDVSAPRNGTIETEVITGEDSVQVQVAASNLTQQTNPPYQLTRVTFDSAGAPVYEVVADNIYKLSFDYFNAAGTEVDPNFGLNGTNNDDRKERATIRKYEIHLKGVADRPDMNYKDPTDTTTMVNRRKFELVQTAVASNLGLKGHKHEIVPAVNIAAPATITVCAGHCRHLRISWPASVSVGISQYKLKIAAPADSTLALAAVASELTVPGTSWEYETPAGDTRTYSFSVASTSGGNKSTYTGPAQNAQVQTTGTSIPNDVTGVTGVQTTGAHSVDVRFTNVTQNTAALGASTCVTAGASSGTSTPQPTWNQAAVDLTSYQVYRTRVGGPADVRVDTGTTATLGELQNTAPLSTPFVDHLAAPCTDYTYRLKACDLCNVTSLAMSPASPVVNFVPSPSTVRPGTTATLSGSSTVAGSVYSVTLNWDPITRTAGGELAATNAYRITRRRKLSNESTFTNPVTFAVINDVLTFTDTSAPTDVGGLAAAYQYTVLGLYPCTPERTGDESLPFTAACAPPNGWNMSIIAPTSTTDMSRPYEDVLTPKLDANGSWAKATVKITGPNGLAYDQTMTGGPSGGQYVFPQWDLSSVGNYPNGQYVMTAVAETSLGCQSPVKTVSFQLSTGTCGLVIVPSSPLLTPDNNGTNGRKELNFQLQNTCDAPLADAEIAKLRFIWTGGTTGATISAVQYNGVNNTTGLTTGSNTDITLTAKVTVPPATTSAAFKILYSGKMQGASWTSIVATTTNPANVDETLTTPIP